MPERDSRLHQSSVGTNNTNFIKATQFNGQAFVQLGDNDQPYQQNLDMNTDGAGGEAFINDDIYEEGRGS